MTAPEIVKVFSALLISVHHGLILSKSEKCHNLASSRPVLWWRWIQENTEKSGIV